jgi:hypothetical protein
LHLLPGRCHYSALPASICKSLCSSMTQPLQFPNQYLGIMTHMKIPRS